MVKILEVRAKRVRLLVRLDATKNPNRQDYLMRLSEVNGLKGIADLTHIFGLQYTGLMALTAESINDLINGRTDCLQVKYPKIQRGQRNAGWNLRCHGWGKEARVCPACLDEERMQPVCFNLSMPLACPHHGLMPIDFCPHCRKSLTYLRKSILHCNCGFLLTCATGFEKPSWLTGLHAIFAPWHLTHVGAHYNMEKYIHLDCLAARLILFVLKGFEKTYPSSYITTDNFEGISRLITDWPAMLWTDVPLFGNFGKVNRKVDRGIDSLLIRDNWILDDAIKNIQEYRR